MTSVVHETPMTVKTIGRLQVINVMDAKVNNFMSPPAFYRIIFGGYLLFNI